MELSVLDQYLIVACLIAKHGLKFLLTRRRCMCLYTARAHVRVTYKAIAMAGHGLGPCSHLKQGSNT